MSSTEIITSPAIRELTSSLQRTTHTVTRPLLTREHYPILYATDLEGPLVLGDFALEIMSQQVHPQNSTASSPDYGGIIFKTTYDWYTETTLQWRRFAGRHYSKNEPAWSGAQEGTDIGFALAPLLATGTTQEMINSAALQFRPTPGSADLRSYLKSQDALVIGVTTAWQEPSDLIGKNIGIDGVVGSPFPIDAAKKVMQELGVWDSEIALVQSFLQDCFTLINTHESTNNNDKKTEYTSQLKNRIEKFYMNELGITFDPNALQRRTQPLTVLGEIIQSIGSVGDRAKAAVAQTLFRQPHDLSITIGDGLNDNRLLQKGQRSVGLNGPDAVQFAEIGVITDSVANLIPIFEVFQSSPHTSTNTVVKLAQQAVGDHAIVHRGGKNTLSELLEEHRKMKKAIRGASGTLIP